MHTVSTATKVPLWLTFSCPQNQSLPRSIPSLFTLLLFSHHHLCSKELDSSVGIRSMKRSAPTWPQPRCCLSSDLCGTVASWSLIFRQWSPWRNTSKLNYKSIYFPFPNLQQLPTIHIPHRMRPDHLRLLNPTPYKVSVSTQLYNFIHDLWLQEAPIPDISSIPDMISWRQYSPKFIFCFVLLIMNHMV
jgi:hypothetical protein